jgi:hypothetical protein
MDLAGVLRSGDHIGESRTAAAAAKALYEQKGDVVSSRRAQAFINGSAP